MKSAQGTSALLLTLSYLIETEKENLSSAAITAETPRVETIAQLTDHLPEIHFASGNKVLDESQSCFEGSLVAQIRAKAQPALFDCVMENRLLCGFLV